MNNVVPITQRSTIEDEASLWVVRIERGLTTEEEKDFKEWIASSKTHYEEFFSLVKFWDETEVLGRLASMFPKEDESPKKRIPLIFSAIAASFVLFVCTLGYFTIFKPEENEQVQPVLFNALLHTEVGKRHTEHLPNGSILDMNTDSTVRVEFGKDYRLIKLQKGELLVKVAHNTLQPLVVAAGDQAVKAVGTAFNVRVVDAEEVKLVITEGHVVVSQLADNREVTSDTIKQSFSEKDKKMSMSEGDLAVLKGRERYLKRLDKDEVDMEVSWKQGNLVFNGEVLEEVVKEISRYSQVEFTIEDESIKQLKIAGIFRTGDVDGFITSLEENLGISATRISDKEVKLSKAASQ